MDTTHLKAFLRIAETGSISRAAQSLGIAQPSLSQQLLRLEDEVGTLLFERTARGVILTDAGRVFRERAQQVLHVADQALADARHVREEARGQIVIAMPPSLASLLGGALVREIAVAAPLVTVRVVEAFSGTIRGWIEAEKIDLGIIYDTGPFMHLVTSRLATDEIVLVGGPERFASGLHEVAPEELRGATLIASGRQHGLRQVLDAYATRHSIDWRSPREADSLVTVLDLAASGFGLGVLPLCAVSDNCWSGKITLARFPHGGLWRPLTLVRNPAHVLTHASVWVGNAVRVLMKQLVSQGDWQARIENGPDDRALNA